MKMNTAGKLLRKQVRQSIFLFLRGAVMLVMSIYIGIMLRTEGLGKTSDNPRGKSALFVKLMKKIFGDRADLDEIMVNCMTGLMVIVAVYSLYCLIKGILRLMPSHTPLGKSVLQQAAGYETLSDIIASIDKDIEQGAKTFGKVTISREWILESQAMRLSSVQGVFWHDEGETDFVLYCVDDRRNVWRTSFLYEDDRAQALKYLNSRFPEFIVGDKKAYDSFLEG